MRRDFLIVSGLAALVALLPVPAPAAARAAPFKGSGGPVLLGVPGSVDWGDWTVVARVGGAGEEFVSAAALGDVVTVRGWRDGDRIRPAGLGGSKTLADVFVDNKIPREMRRTLPVLETAGGEIAWVAGVVVAEGFRAEPGAPGTVALSARPRG